MSWTEVSKINRDMSKSLDALINEKSTSITNKLDALDILINNRSFPLLNNGTQVGTKRIKGATVKHIKNYKLDSANKLSAFTQKTPNCPYAIQSYVEVDGVIYALCGTINTSGYPYVAYVYIYKCDLSATSPVWSLIDTFGGFSTSTNQINQVIKSNLVYIKKQKKLLYICKQDSSSYRYSWFYVYDLTTNTSTRIWIYSGTNNVYLFPKFVYNYPSNYQMTLFYKNNKLWVIPAYAAYQSATGTGAFCTGNNDADLLRTSILPILWSIDLNVLETVGNEAFYTQFASNKSIQNCLYAYRGGISEDFRQNVFSASALNQLSITPIVEDDYMLFICSSQNFGSVVKIDLNEKDILDFSSIDTSTNTINHKLAPAYAVREISTMQNQSYSSYPRYLLSSAFIYNKIVYVVEYTSNYKYNLYMIDENTLARTLVIPNETIFANYKLEALTDDICNGFMYLAGPSIYTGGINKEQVLNKINDVDEFEFIFE